jgi:hypothetical protein
VPRVIAADADVQRRQSWSYLMPCRLRLIESREVEEIRDLLELRQGKGARWFEQI